MSTILLIILVLLLLGALPVGPTAEAGDMVAVGSLVSFCSW